MLGLPYRAAFKGTYLFARESAYAQTPIHLFILQMQAMAETGLRSKPATRKSIPGLAGIQAHESSPVASQDLY